MGIFMMLHNILTLVLLINNAYYAVFVIILILVCLAFKRSVSGVAVCMGARRKM